MSISATLSAPDAALLALRPTLELELPAEPTDTVGTFLHRTLRPVLKLQNQHLLTALADFLLDHHVPFRAAAEAERRRLVAELLARNTKLRYTIIGLMTAMFTTAETAFYRAHRPELNRRLLELAVRRAQDQTAAIAALDLPG